MLTYAAAAERRHTHPIALAIVQAAQACDLPLPSLDDAHYQLGYGITVMIDGGQVRVGSARFMQQERITIPPVIEQTIADAYRRGVSVVLVAVNTHLAGVLELQATLRPEVRQVINALRQRNLALHILSGDHTQPTQQLADDLGIEHYAAEVLPDEKAKVIADLQAAGKSVCFVGDGINDTLAMKEAVVSVSLRGATTAATDTAHVVLMHQDLRQLLALFKLQRACQRSTRASIVSILGPAVISVTGALFFGTGIAFTEYMNHGSFPLSVANAMLSRWWYRTQTDTKTGPAR